MPVMNFTGTKTINIITLGCSKNIVDSEFLAGQIKHGGYQVVHNSNDNNADVVIINTCGFIEDAKTESIDTILNVINSETDNPKRKVFVMGCMSERYKDVLKKDIPEVDLYFGLNETGKILKSLGMDHKHELIGSRDQMTPAHYAYLKISEGCDRTCSFCAIPLIRGKHRSRTAEDIVKEAKNLASGGVKELILIAQDLTYYGRDIYKRPNLSELLKQLSKIDGINWIRLHYTYPAGFPDDLSDLIRENPKINKYIDIPIQHINNKMLKSMRRGINRENTIKLLNKLRNEIPGLALRTTLIVGHPGETDNIFQELKDFVRETRFDRLGVFTYSHEEDTWSYKKYKDEIPEEIKQKRMEELLTIQSEISFELNQKKIGREFDVIIDNKENKYYVGRTRFDSPEIDNEVLIPEGKSKIEIGNIYRVKIYSAEEFDLYAELL